MCPANLGDEYSGCQQDLPGQWRGRRGIQSSFGFDAKPSKCSNPVLTLACFPHSLVGKESACNAGDPGSIPGSGRSPGEGIGYPLQYFWASLVAQLVKNLLQCGRPGFDLQVEKIPWRRERLPTPVFWPGEFRGLYSPQGRKESDTTEWLSLSLQSVLNTKQVFAVIVIILISKFWE